MPLYEYRCQVCGNEFEKMVPLSAIGARQVCPSCNSEETEKKISVFATAGSSTRSSAVSASSCSSSGGRFT